MGLAHHIKKHEERPTTETPLKATESRPRLKPRRAALKQIIFLK